MDLCLRFNSAAESLPVTLPASKSEQARLIMINAYSPRRIRSGSRTGNCDDITVLRDALRHIGKERDVYIGASGTAMRFLTAYAASLPGVETRLYGDRRMESRPVGPLVDALRRLGAVIEYEKKEGFPPLLIKGKELEGRKTRIPGEMSSQYISALLLMGCRLPQGLELTLTGKRSISRPYINMTRALMACAGVPSWEEGRIIRVENGEYRPMRGIIPRPDWTAASYFYSFAALTGRRVQISGLGDPSESLQGDALLARIFSLLGVSTEVTPAGDVVLEPAERQESLPELNLGDNPDLVPAVAVTAAGLSLPFRLHGIGHLRIKESDRLGALAAEMRKLGFVLTAGIDSLSWDGTRCEAEKIPVIDTYDDHRLAMSLSMAACFFPTVVIRDAQVVRKSFQKFWHQVSRVGIKFYNKEQGGKT